MSCAYALRAARAQKQGNAEIAWADARYWCGAAIADKGIGEVSKQTREKTRSEAARLANEGRQWLGQMPDRGQLLPTETRSPQES